MKKILLFLLPFFVIGCNTTGIEGTYESIWYETYHKLSFRNNNNYVYIFDGHMGVGEYAGKYKINGDTVKLKGTEAKKHLNSFLILEDGCLAELETRFDYCKDTDNIKGKRNINYPQLEARNNREKEDIKTMLLTAFTHPELKEYFDTTQNLIVQEYYEINQAAEMELICFDKPIALLSKEEIERKKITEYLIIDEITVGSESVMIDFQVMPEEHIGILDFFSRDNGKWRLHERR